MALLIGSVTPGVTNCWGNSWGLGMFGMGIMDQHGSTIFEQLQLHETVDASVELIDGLDGPLLMAWEFQVHGRPSPVSPALFASKLSSGLALQTWTVIQLAASW